MQNTIYRKCSWLAAFLAILAGCSGGGSDGGSTSGDMMRPRPPAVAGTEFADLNPTNAGYAAIAVSRAADARPRSGSITQSSNVNNGITVDRVTVTAQHGAGRNSYSIRNGTLWSVGTSDGNPVDVDDAPPPFDVQELHKRIPGGTLYVDVYSDIEAPSLREVGTSGGTPVRLEDSLGSTIGGLTLDEINARMGDGELDGVPGTFFKAKGIWSPSGESHWRTMQEAISFPSPTSMCRFNAGIHLFLKPYGARKTGFPF